MGRRKPKDKPPVNKKELVLCRHSQKAQVEEKKVHMACGGAEPGKNIRLQVLGLWKTVFACLLFWIYAQY